MMKIGAQLLKNNSYNNLPRGKEKDKDLQRSTYTVVILVALRELYCLRLL